MNIVHTWKFGLVSRLFLLQECFLAASGPTVYLAVAVHGYFSYLSQAEVEVLGGGAPTLLNNFSLFLWSHRILTVAVHGYFSYLRLKAL